MLNVGVIGYGYWGPNVARNFHASAGVNLVGVSDSSKERVDLAKKNYPFIRGAEDPLELVRAADIDAVAIVTPVTTHYELAKASLLAGKHVFVEKPFTATSDQAKELIDIASRSGLKIMVDHTFLFTGAVKKIKQVVDNGELGELIFYDSVRVNLGLFQHDVNVVWDLAPHDLSIMGYLINKKPVAITAHGSVHFNGRLEDMAYIIVDFNENDFMAHFYVNWLSPVKVRKTMIGGDKKTLVWDDVAADEKIKIYDRGVDVKNGKGRNELLVSYRAGDVYTPKLDNTEALFAEVEYFVRCIEKNEEPFNNGISGLGVVKLLEAADESLKQGGKKIEL